MMLISNKLITAGKFLKDFLTQNFQLFSVFKFVSHSLNLYIGAAISFEFCLIIERTTCELINQFFH